MSKSPEQFYDQHRKDAERVEKTKSAYDKHLEQAREAGDLTKHPELWDQASVEYQAEAKEKIAEAVKAGNYDMAEELISGLRVHLDTNKQIVEREKRGGLEQDEWETYQYYRKNIESLINEISDPLTKKKMLRKSALLFDKTGSTEHLFQKQMIECALLALELEKAANQEGVGFSVASFRNPREMTTYKTLDKKMDARGMVGVIKQLEIRNGEGPTEEAEQLEKVFAELSTQGEKDQMDYPKDIIYFTDGETNSPQKTREVLGKIGQLVNIEVVLVGGASRETIRFYDGIKGVRVSVVPNIQKLPSVFGEILKAKYTPELLVGNKEEISESEAEAEARKKIEKMAEVNLRDDISRMVSESDWQHAKDKVLGRLDDIRDLSQLAEMRVFDPDRFDKEFDVERLRGRIREIVRREEGNPIYYLLAARDLKLVSGDNDRFVQEVNNLILDNAVKEVRQCKHYPKEFLVLASALKDIDPERFQLGIANDVLDSWPQISRFIEEMSPIYRPYYLGLAQNIKPDSKPDITLNERAWDEYKRELGYTLHQRYSFDEFFRAANKVSRLKLEGEK